MGTRSITRVFDDEKREVLRMYRHFDGYPSGHGADLKRVIGNLRLVNGYSEEDTVPGVAANGIGCLAAQLVANLKEGIGNIDITYVGENYDPDDYWAEYTYEIRPEGDYVGVKCIDCDNKVVYEGMLKDWDTEKEEV